jgi:two-component system C4-dicarboxylate transport sensor histidine kinase DctB
MMSAGIAHEINTPLAVVKGLAERLQSRPGHELTPEESRLMHRVVTRLERLSESLLDYARARPSQARATPLRTLAEEAIQLVKLDRAGERVRTTLDVPPEMNAFCDGDRILQVFVNLLRNAFDALGAHPSEPTVNFSARTLERDGRAFVAVSIADNGPGISPEILPRLFEPFASTRLDARGTGLGLAVSEGIVREHGGVLVARNRSDTPGAVFEVLLPAPADATIRASARQESPD